MMGDRPGEELITVVRRRADVLTALADGPLEKPDIESTLTVSRSTVDRALRELRSHSLVDRTSTGYVTTLPGRLALAEYDRTIASIADVNRARDLLAHLPSNAPLPRALLDDAEVYHAEPPAPRSPLERLRELVLEADCYRGLGTALFEPNYVPWILDRVQSGSLELAFVNTTKIATYLAETYGDVVTRALDTGRYRIHVNDDIPLDLGVITGGEGAVYLLVADEDATFRGLLVNTSPAAIEWGESLFERYRDRGDPFDPRDADIR